MFLPDSSAGMDLCLRHRRVILDVSVKGAATATDVRQASDVPGGVYLATESLDNAAAEDSGCNFGTIENNNAGASIMGVLIQAPQTLGGKISKLFSVSVAEVTSTAGTVTSALKGASSSGVTADGNVAFTIAGSTANLSADTVTYRVTLECAIEEQK
jgi:hypothetical protein